MFGRAMFGRACVCQRRHIEKNQLEAKFIDIFVFVNPRNLSRLNSLRGLHFINVCVEDIVSSRRVGMGRYWSLTTVRKYEQDQPVPCNYIFLFILKGENVN
jgi:hypothetical protein